jgi:hypothetical protein
MTTSALRAGRRFGFWPALVLTLSLVVLTVPTRARGELNNDEKAKINQAIDRGVDYLKKQQLADGSWPAPEGKHLIGYTVLPALTLLESGVPATDPGIKKVAAVVRKVVPLREGPLKVDGTYEIALCILFLDRLGDPADKKLIQTLALRLVAGQMPTGGWSYTCPLLTPAYSQDVLATLRALPELPPLNLDVAPGATGGEMVDVTINMAFFGSVSYKASPGQVPGASSSTSPGENGTASEQSTSNVSPESKPFAAHLSRQNYCIKALEPPPADADPKPATKDRDKGDKPKDPPKTVTIPAHLRGLPVFIDPAKVPMIEIKDRVTDNSNTQFAILALWTAQRHDVPMDRTLRLLVRRFQVSQHPQAGSWDYHFVLGGSDKESPQMTAVGLLGLAVGHGLAAPNRGAPIRGQVRNIAILKGFTALNRWVGIPQGKWEGLEQPNLYYLWSLERVAVLYNMELIGGKDWYRWGAEILVANQTPAGHWQNGKYYGSSPVLDTCFALLFLQRVNLAKDLSAKLPFDPTELNGAVSEQAKKDAEKKAPPRDDSAKNPSPVEPTPPQPPSMTELTDSKDPAGDRPETKAVSQPTTPTESRRDPTPTTEPDEKRKTWRNVLLGAFAVLLLGFGIFVAVYLSRGRKEEVVARKPKPKKKVATKSAKG